MVVIAGAGLIVRTTPLGLTTFLDLASAGGEMPSWELELPGEERLVAAGRGGAAVIAPARQTLPRPPRAAVCRTTREQVRLRRCRIESEAPPPERSTAESAWWRW